MWRLVSWKVIGGIISWSAETHEWKTQCFSTEEEGRRKKVVKIHRTKKRNQLQNTLHSINCSKDRKGQTARLARCLAVNGAGGTTLYKKKWGLKLQNGKLPIHTGQSVVASLHHCPHIVHVSPDSMCGLVFVSQARPYTVTTDPSLFFNFTSNAMPRCSSPLLCSDLW